MSSIDNRVKAPQQRLDMNLETRLNQEEILAIAQKASIWDLQKVLKQAGVSQSDIQNYFGTQHAKFMVEIVKSEPWYAVTPIEEPSNYYQTYSMPPSRPELGISDPEMKAFIKSMGRIAKTTNEGAGKKPTDTAETGQHGYSGSTAGIGGKAMTNKGSKAADEIEDNADEEEPENVTETQGTELDSLLDDQLDALDDLMEKLSYSITDQQIVTDATNKSDEIRREIARLMALAKSGSVDASFVVIAMAKYTCAKNGSIFSSLGKKLYSMNDQINQVNSTLYGKEFDLANSQIVANKQRDLNFQMQQLQTSMQDVTKNITTVMEFANNTLNMIERTRRDIRSNLKV